jgi:hypothetical protein
MICRAAALQLTRLICGARARDLRALPPLRTRRLRRAIPLDIHGCPCARSRLKSRTRGRPARRGRRQCRHARLLPHDAGGCEPAQDSQTCAMERSAQVVVNEASSADISLMSSRWAGASRPAVALCRLWHRRQLTHERLGEPPTPALYFCATVRRLCRDPRPHAAGRRGAGRLIRRVVRALIRRSALATSAR